jgi:hypothetical protein
MKKYYFSLIALIAVSLNLSAQTETPGAASNRRTVTMEITPSQRTAISTANSTAARAAADYNKRVRKTQDGTGGNERSSSAISVLKTTREGVTIYTDGSDNLTYDPARNAFIPVSSRQQAVRIATKAYEPANDGAGQKLRTRKPSPTGDNAEVIKGVTENRSRVKTQESEEDDLSKN